MTGRRSILPPALAAADASARFERERRRLLSVSRLRLAFTLFVVLLLLALSALNFVLVSRIFDTLTPKVQADLEHRARRAAAALANNTELGVVTGDARDIKASFDGYDKDPDILAIVVADVQGKVLAVHGRPSEAPEVLFRPPARGLRKAQGYYVSWAEVAVEGEPVGRVAVVVSTARLRAGDELKRNILLSAAAGGIVAFLLALLFVGLYIHPIVRVTEDAFIKLEKTTAQALEAARLKSEFLANMSHEIRTPMNGVLGMIELLSRSSLADKQRRHLGTLHTSANALMSVLNDILDFSKIEAGKLELHQENCRVRVLVEEVAELFAARAELRGLRIVTDVTPEVPLLVEADTERVRQVLSNLVGNAVKFTETGSITLRASVEEAQDQLLQLRFEVKDTGVGIDPALQDRLFSAFSQIDGSLTRKHGGTGLGLAICKQLVTLMRGRIGVESEANKGSTFWFVLPLRRLESTGSLRVERRSSGSPLAQPSPSAGSSRRILVAEDNPVNQEVMSEVLAALGYEAHIVENGLLALAALERQAFPLVLMDCQMPELDGYGAAREIRRRELPGQHVPLIAVTAHAFEGEREKALAAGMDGYVTKPIDARALSAAIQAFWPTAPTAEPESGERPASPDSPAQSVDAADEPLLSSGATQSPAIARVFLKHVPAQIESIAAAYAEGDAAGLKLAAHRLKGSCLTVGVPRMARSCERLEDGSADAAAEIEALRRVFALIEPELRPLAQTEASGAAG